MRIIALSDTHGCHRTVDVPQGDVLVFAGDITVAGNVDDVHDFNDWLGSVSIPHKIIIPGNNDICLDSKYCDLALENQKIITNGKLLIHEKIEIDGVKFFCAPGTKRYKSPAFTLGSVEEAYRCWNRIPVDTDILVTHGPAKGILDISLEVTGTWPQGCPVLRHWIDVFKPRLHIHGHIHSDTGIHQGQDTTTMNVAICSTDVGDYNPSNLPTIFNFK